MASAPRIGRPRASSRATLADAACELFLERGYEQTSIADIASRAGVSRSSFFNYFASKSDILWSGFDERMATIAAALDRGEPVHDALSTFGTRFTPDSLALAIVNAEAMGLSADLERERALRLIRLARHVAASERSTGADPLAAEIDGAAYAAAILAALWQWAAGGAGTSSLSAFVERALALVASSRAR